jgi:hypothetical protein
MTRRPGVKFVLAAALAVAVACGGSVASDIQARQAYTGLDLAVQKGMNLGFAGFNAASSANISPQQADGGVSGTIKVTGQVDQGASANKGMRLNVELTDYSDGTVTIPDQDPVEITYRTLADAGAVLPKLDLQLRNIPSGTFSGTMVGAYEMIGDLTGTVELNLAMDGQIEPNGDGGTRRKDGSTTITGTAKSGAGTYNVNVTR